MRGLLILVLILTSTSVKGQSLTVLDKNDTPVSFVHVRFTDIDNKESIIISNDMGVVKLPNDLNKQAGILTLISHISHVTYLDTLLFIEDITIHLEPSEILLDQVVVTAQMTENISENAVQKIKIIDQKRIAAQGAVSLRDLLEQETNVRLSQDNILGSSISIQGVSGQNVKILMDGVPIIGRLNGNIDVSQINLNNIERIEIVEGPLSVNYGTDALAGTINLISKKSGESNLFINSYYETVGKYNLDCLMNYSANNHQLSLSGGRNYFDGWSPSDNFRLIPTATIADTNRYKQWKPKEQYFARAQDVFSKNEWSIRTYADFFFEEILNRGFPRMPYFETAFDDIYNTWRKTIGLDFNTKVNDKNLSVIVSYNNYKRIKNTYFNELTTLEEVISENEADQDTSVFNSVMSRGSFGGAFSENISTEIGYDIVIEEARGRRIEGNTQNQGDFALYSNTEWRPSDKLIIRPGVRLSYNTDYTAPLAPSIHIKYNYKKFILRSSFAKGFRAPSLKDLYFEFVDINHNIVGNPNLKAENSNNYQLSVDWKNIRNNYIIRGEMSFFYNDIHDLITLANTADDAYSYINIGKYKTLGTKANINVTYEFIKFNAGVSYIGRQNDIDEVAPYSYALEWISNCTYEITKWNSKVAVYYKNTGALPSFWMNAEGEVLESTIDGYQMMDVTYSWSNPRNPLKVVVGCKNAFDVKNVNSISGLPGAHQSDASGMSVGYGRTFFTSLKWSLK